MIVVHAEVGEFHLQTAHTSYLLRVAPSGHLLHLHYGRRLHDRPDFGHLVQEWATAQGSSTTYRSDLPLFNLNACTLEWSGLGKGDYRELPTAFTLADGTTTHDPVYVGHRVLDQKPALEGLPSCFGASQSLEITLEDAVVGLRVVLLYGVFEDSDVVTRSARVENLGSQPLTVDALASAQLDFDHDGFELVTLDGRWIAERTPHRRALAPGLQGVDSKKGVSSADHSPFLALVSPDTTETHGEVYALALVYSGNHRAVVEVCPHGFTRALIGLNPHDFAWHLEAGASLQSPEAVLTFSAEGLGGMSRNLHTQVRRHLVAPRWQGVDRPILINNWEATYFDFSEAKLVKLAQAAAALGIELFVLDDGWFGRRDDDTTSLGDWVEHPRKLPRGLAGLAAKIRRAGLQFGLWVEPEMVSIDSDLYRAHPDWALALPGRQPSLGRFQLLLDLGNPAVQDHLFDVLSGVFRRAGVSYVKWDHNRNFSDVFSAVLPPHRQKEATHRCTLGLYRLLDRLVAAFPDVLFESCSSGGNRFDLGLLAYMPQTWTSDNTDALERQGIQWGTSYVFPPSTMGAHVSGEPSHQVLRSTPLETRFHVAAFGLLGYELDLTKLPDFDRQVMAHQVAWYKRHRHLLQFGTFYRLSSPFDGNVCRWMVVSDDKSTALFADFQRLQRPNPGLESLRLTGLDADALYRVETRQQFQNIRLFGDQINRVLPVPLRVNGVLHSALADRYLLPVKAESVVLRGDELMHVGLRTPPPFTGTAYNDGVRLLGDFGSRLYVLTRVEEGR